MRTVKNTLALIAALALLNTTIAQTVFNVKSDATLSSLKFPSQCNKCEINIADGVKLTIDMDIYLQNVTFNGGTIIADKKITFWAAGQFNNTSVNFTGNAGIVSSGELKITNTEFIFNKVSTATFWSTVNMDASKMVFLDDASKMVFLDDASMEVTSNFNMYNNSSLVAGDGSLTSKAFIKFNGGTLNQYAHSSVTIANYNNYYFNWSAYNVYDANNSRKSVQTTNNKLNCGTAGKSNCESPKVFGPSTLNYGGVASYALLPVKLSAFNVKLNGNQISLTWTTDMEANASRFEIERTLDGINWNKVGTVQAQGNSSSKVNYIYTDHLKAVGVVGYRLKMIDQDETFEYSAIRSVKIEGTVQVNMFPNPATNYVTINAKDNTSRTAQLITLNGQVIKQINGNGTINIQLTDCKAGNYFVRVVDAYGAAQTFKLMINK